ncbi:transcriptional regulator [Saccharomonospora marina XMU15]|uniref:Transcriptional regulator n=1 Tax=Saccharomonospora marina XMU15 TaxID=882083 RepID=H5X295_9PSEU|nr:MarR family transcriptional regulator [Saccharomonospora marina]EHR48691.1 transcriptional regulator [Saccharomonospora marina XMU15]
MTEVSRRTRWLTDTEMLAWRSYIVSTLKLRQRLHRELTDQHDVSLTDYEVLVCLSQAEEGSMRMTELAQLLGSTKSRLSHQVARMEEAGYLRRGKDLRDRRGVTAELTQQGERLLERSAPTHVEGVREHFVDLLTTEEQLLVGEVFSRVLAHLTELED